MNWGSDYFTFSDTNIEYIWRFLRSVHERGWLYLGHRSTEWCPRCGTSISAHESSARTSTAPTPPVRPVLPLERQGEALVVWTTTPWTLPANVAAAVKPDAEPAGARTASGSRSVATRTRRSSSGSAARSWSAGAIPARSTTCRRARRRAPVIPWEDVSSTTAPASSTSRPVAAPRTSSSRCPRPARLTPVDEVGPVLRRVRLAARALDGRGCRTDHRLSGGARPPGRGGPARAPLPRVLALPHAADLPDLRRLAIAVDELRQQLRDANAKVEWTPAYMGKRMDDWLVNMGDWNISRRRYYGLPPSSTRAAAAT